MLEKYAQDKGFPNIQFYVDDGYSGANFNRPDFQRMLADMDMGYISTVIVKDSSRFGRNYLEVGQYTDYYFPENNIRFIAINDCIDSENGEDELAPFRNVMNEMYAKDISRKVRSSHRLRGNAGEPLSQPPYGYMKDPTLMSAEKVIKAATVNGAVLQGRKNAGNLLAGYKADFVVLSTDKPNMRPCLDPAALVVYSAGRQDVYMTVCDGKVLYKNGDFLTLDKERIYYNVRKATLRLY